MYSDSIPSLLEGRFAIVTNVEPGCDGRGRRADERAACHGRRSRVVPTPRRWCQVDDDASASRRRRRQESPIAEESTKKAVKTIAQGRPDGFGVPVVTTLVCSFHFACEAAGAPWRPVFPAPSTFRGSKTAR